MKGNFIVKKMIKLTRIEADCMEDLSYMMLDGSTKKEMAVIIRKLKKASKKYRNVWNHNMPHGPRKEQDRFFQECRKPYFFEEPRVDECVIDWRDTQELLKRGE